MQLVLSQMVFVRWTTRITQRLLLRQLVSISFFPTTTALVTWDCWTLPPPMVVSFSSFLGKEIPLLVPLVCVMKLTTQDSAKNLYSRWIFFPFLDSPTEVTHNPLPKEEEIQWILNEVEHYLSPGKFH